MSLPPNSCGDLYTVLTVYVLVPLYCQIESTRAIDLASES